MRKLIAAEFITLDGFIARKNDQMDFFNSFNDQDMFLNMVNAQKDWDALLMGRITFELLSSFWPNSPNKDNPIANFMNTVSKIVVSKTSENFQWGETTDIHIIKDNLGKELLNLKEKEGKNIAILGSANLIQTLINENLIDEFLLHIYPVMLGKGKSLFGNLNALKNLKLIESKVFKSGIIEIKYKVE